jgi:hypothetical protein
MELGLEVEQKLRCIIGSLNWLSGAELRIEFMKKYGKKFINELNLRNISYNQLINSCKDKYGVEFPDLQKQYEEMLPKINKYLGIKSERTPEQTQALSNLSIKTQYGNEIEGN